MKKTLTRSKGRLEMSLLILSIGEDYHLSLIGGENIGSDAHIGCSALGIPNDQWHKNTLGCHKEGALIDSMIAFIDAYYKPFSSPPSYSLIAGVHLDHITQEELNDVFTLTDLLMKDFLHQVL